MYGEYIATAVVSTLEGKVIQGERYVRFHHQVGKLETRKMYAFKIFMKSALFSSVSTNDVWYMSIRYCPYTSKNVQTCP